MKRIIFYFVIVALGMSLAVNMLENARLKETVPTSAESAMPVSKKIVMLDAGHGGFDPGAVAGSTLEKDINLAIAKKTQAYLETGDAFVLMTRTDDSALASNKQTDMYRRQRLANESGADIFVSIHQNTFEDASARGAQVYYFATSEDGKRLADCIQDEIRKATGSSHSTQPMANSDYYVLRQTNMPSVIVECGFLTNPAERRKLKSDEYQDQIAWAIYRGIVDYFNLPS